MSQWLEKPPNREVDEGGTWDMTLKGMGIDESVDRKDDLNPGVEPQEGIARGTDQTPWMTVSSVPEGHESTEEPSPSF